MARFDLHRLGGVLVVDLQHDLLDHLPTRVVAPLLPPDQAGQPVRDLHPVFEFDGGTHILALHQRAAVPRRELGPAIGTQHLLAPALLRPASRCAPKVEPKVASYDARKLRPRGTGTPLS